MINTHKKISLVGAWMKRFVVYLFLTADSKIAMYLNIIYGFVGLVGLLIVLIVSFACYKIFKRLVATRLDFRRFLESGLRFSPRREFRGGARAPFPNSGW